MDNTISYTLRFPRVVGDHVEYTFHSDSGGSVTSPALDTDSTAPNLQTMIDNLNAIERWRTSILLLAAPTEEPVLEETATVEYEVNSAEISVKIDVGSLHFKFIYNPQNKTVVSKARPAFTVTWRDFLFALAAMKTFVLLIRGEWNKLRQL